MDIASENPSDPADGATSPSQHILLHKSEGLEVDGEKNSFPYQGKVDREARRKGSLPSISVFLPV